MFLVSSCSCLCPIHWSQALSREWSCSWSSADRRCSITTSEWSTIVMPTKAWFIRGLTVVVFHCGEASIDHYDDVIMTTMASQITSLAVVYSIVYSGVYQRKHQSSASLAFVRRIHRWPVNSPHKWPETRKIFPFDDVIMTQILPCSVPSTSVTIRNVPVWRNTEECELIMTSL